MTTYLLDTNACIALINGRHAHVRRRFQRAIARDSVILLSSVVAFELWYGVEAPVICTPEELLED